MRFQTTLAYRILSDIYDKVSSSEFEYPVFVFVEEAHRFIPIEGRTDSEPNHKKDCGRRPKVRSLSDRDYSAAFQDSS